MTRLPKGDQAILDIRKLEDYCLSAVHPRGRHKARVFLRSLGIDRSNAHWLRATILKAAGIADAQEVSADGFGRRWQMDIPVARHGKQGMIRTIWIQSGADAPRFVTCWML